MRFIIAIMAVALADHHCKDDDGNSLVPEKCGDGVTGLVVDCADYIKCGEDTMAKFWPDGVATEAVPATCAGWMDPTFYETCEPGPDQVDPDCAGGCWDELEHTNLDATITEAQACTDASKFWVTCLMKDVCTPTDNVVPSCAAFMGDDVTWACEDDDAAGEPVPTGTVGDCNLGDAHECHAFVDCVEAAPTCKDWFAVLGDDFQPKNKCDDSKVKAADDIEGADAAACCLAPDCEAIPTDCENCKAFAMEQMKAQPCTDAIAAAAKKAADAAKDMSAEDIAAAAKENPCGLPMTVGENTIDATNPDATCQGCLDHNMKTYDIPECAAQLAANKDKMECKTETSMPSLKEEVDMGDCDLGKAMMAGCDAYKVCIEMPKDTKEEEPEAPTNTPVDEDTQAAIEEALGDDFPAGLFDDDGKWNTTVLKKLKDADLDKICGSDKVDQKVCDAARAHHKYEAPDNTSAAFIAGIGAMSFLALLL